MNTVLTRQELTNLTEEAQQLRDWTIIKDFCDQVYGPERVARFNIDTYGEYDDEGNTNYYIESIYAEDSRNNEVSFDLSLPFWSFLFNKGDLSSREDQDEALDVLKEWYGDSEGNNWVAWEDLPTGKESNRFYVLADPPSLGFTVSPL